MKIAPGLKLRAGILHPGSRPEIEVRDGYNVVMYVGVSEDGSRCFGYLMDWGLCGPQIRKGLNEAQIAAIMGWRLPAAVEKAA